MSTNKWWKINHNWLSIYLSNWCAFLIRSSNILEHSLREICNIYKTLWQVFRRMILMSHWFIKYQLTLMRESTIAFPSWSGCAEVPSSATLLLDSGIGLCFLRKQGWIPVLKVSACLQTEQCVYTLRLSWSKLQSIFELTVLSDPVTKTKNISCHPTRIKI